MIVLEVDGSYLAEIWVEPSPPVNQFNIKLNQFTELVYHRCRHTAVSVHCALQSEEIRRGKIRLG
jgi:hypothetical protein